MSKHLRGFVKVLVLSPIFCRNYKAESLPRQTLNATTNQTQEFDLVRIV